MSPFWFKQHLTNFSCGLDAVVFFLYYCLVLLLLAGNCLPFHQPMCPTTKDPKRAFVLSWFLITVFRWGFVFTFSWGVLQPTTLVRSQLHQMHLMHPT